MQTLTAPGLVDTRPSARGWIHLIAFWFTPALAGALVTIAAVRSGSAAVGAAVYCASMAALFGTSALYHRRRWSDRGWRIMRRLDHAMIFVFIAGTYTPLGLLALSGATKWWMLGVVWGGCAIGVILKVANPHGARWMTVPLYIAVGWAAVFVLGDIASYAGLSALVLLVAGGLLYTVGAVFYATHWPNPAPTVFGYHEVFHLLTVLAAVCQYIAVFLAIAGGPIT